MLEYALKFCRERDPRINLGPSGIRTHNLPLSTQMLLSLSYRNPDDSGAEIGVGEAQAVNLSLTRAKTLKLSSCAALPCREVPGRSHFHANPTREL